MISSEAAGSQAPYRSTESPEVLALAPGNLLSDLLTLASSLELELESASSLDAFLLAAGILQIVDDFLHRDPFSSRKVTGHVRPLRTPVGPLLARLIAVVASQTDSVRDSQARKVGLLAWRNDFASLVDALADRVVSGGWQAPHDPTPGALMSIGRALIARVGTLPASLKRSVVRLPACFRSFDQHPDDLASLVRQFADSQRDKTQVLLVVGLRTSGSYLAPLLASMLRREGFVHVSSLSWRSGQRPLSTEKAHVAHVVRAGGLVLLTDDPPSTGSQLARAAADMEEAGFPRSSIVLMLQLFGTRGSLPAPLSRYASVVLPWKDWTVHERLTTANVHAALVRLRAFRAEIESVERLPIQPPVSNRRHVEGLYKVRVNAAGARSERLVYVKGVGLGYFGNHAVAVARPLSEFLPEVFGVRDGLLFREWLPEEMRTVDSVTADADDTVSSDIVAYTLARNRRLAVADDVSLRLEGRHPIWQCASDLLAPSFGRSAVIARPVLHRVARRLLRVERPSVLDGSMSLSHWFRPAGAGPAGRTVKIDFEERAFCTYDRYCYDPVYDLAGAAVSFGAEQAGQLRRSYERASSTMIEDERWFLYQWLHLQEEFQQGGRKSDRAYRAMSRVQQRLFSRYFFEDVMLNHSGRICAFDVDGVLEDDRLGFSGTTPAACIALRALSRHGLQPVLVTGRSLADVRDRCTAYRLAGGVAEYGAVLFDARSGQERVLLTPADVQVLADLRSVLGELDGVSVDPDHGYAVRAYRQTDAGERRSLTPQMVDAALARCISPELIRTIPGWSQTDFMVTSVDKGTGLRALAGVLRQGRAADDRYVEVAVAVGDTVADLPMFALASVRMAPANADEAVRASGARISKRSHQGSVTEGVELVLGHRPGGCTVCRAVPLSADSRLMLAVLGAQDRAVAGKLQAVVEIGLRLMWADRPRRLRAAADSYSTVAVVDGARHRQ